MEETVFFSLLDVKTLVPEDQCARRGTDAKRAGMGLLDKGTNFARRPHRSMISGKSVTESDAAVPVLELEHWCLRNDAVPPAGTEPALVVPQAAFELLPACLRGFRADGRHAAF